MSSITAGDCFVVLAPFSESKSVIFGRNSVTTTGVAAADEPSEIQYFAATHESTPNQKVRTFIITFYFIFIKSKKKNLN